MEEPIFDNHELFNKYQVLQGMRPSEGGTKPSIYISALKIRKALKTLTKEEIEDLFDREMQLPAERVARERLNRQLEILLDWQVIYALGMLFDLGNYKTAEYILKAKNSDLQIDYSPKEN